MLTIKATGDTAVLISLNDDQLVSMEITPWQTVDAWLLEFDDGYWEWIS